MVAEAIARISPLRINDVRTEWEALRKGERQSDVHAKLALHLTQQRAARAKELYLSCDPSHAEVRNVLEEELEECVTSLARLKREIGAGDPEADFTRGSWLELEELCRDVSAIWDAPATEHRDRKELLRLLIAAVVVTKHTPEVTLAHVRWADGGPAAPIEIVRAKRAHQEIWSMHVEGVSSAEITDRLNATGARTQQGNRWSEPTVRRTIGVIATRMRK